MSGHFRRRGKRQELQIALIRKLWDQPVVEHQDSDHRIDRAGILTRPKRQTPIRLGGFSEAAFDRAARIADGFLFSGRTQTEAIQIKARITAELLELGRADAFGFESIQQYSRGDNQWPGDIAAWRDAGGSPISVVTMGQTSLHSTATSTPSSVGVTSITRSVRAEFSLARTSSTCECPVNGWPPRLRAAGAKSALGHEERFPPRRLSGRCGVEGRPWPSMLMSRRRRLWVRF
jgi:hypothetical protein